MRTSRFFIHLPLMPYFNQRQPLILADETHHHLQRVLRLRLHDGVTLFDGLGGEYSAKIIDITKKNSTLQLLNHHAIEAESPLKTTLIAAISRPEHMDYSVQKAVELGVTEIVPLISQRSPPINSPALDKRQQHWQKIIQNACEQCGRNRLPQLRTACHLSTFLQQPTNEGAKWLLVAEAKQRLHDFQRQKFNYIQLVIGTEGGLTPTETQQLQNAGYQAVAFGQRILRTETASSALLAVCQAWWGDCG
jgi:16S rRNA (uracil1498-N3)-methyltransferase